MPNSTQIVIYCDPEFYNGRPVGTEKFSIFLAAVISEMAQATHLMSFLVNGRRILHLLVIEKLVNFMLQVSGNPELNFEF